MANATRFRKGIERAGSSRGPELIRRQPEASLHPTWRAFMGFCGELRYGEIDCLKIQDGLPILAEVTRKKIKFAP